MAFGDLIRRGEREREESLRTASRSVQPAKDEGLGLLGTTPGYRRESARLARVGIQARRTPEYRLAEAGAREAELRTRGMQRLATGREAPLFTGLQRVTAPYKHPFEIEKGRAEAGLARLGETEHRRLAATGESPYLTGVAKLEGMQKLGPGKALELEGERLTNYARGKYGTPSLTQEGKTIWDMPLEIQRGLAAAQALGDVPYKDKLRIVQEAEKRQDKIEKMYSRENMKKFLDLTGQPSEPEDIDNAIANASYKGAVAIETMLQKAKETSAPKTTAKPEEAKATPEQNLVNYRPLVMAPRREEMYAEGFPIERVIKRLGELRLKGGMQYKPETGTYGF